MENAECSTELGGHCRCKENYFPANGSCLQLRKEGEKCSGSGQCVEHAECLPPGNGTCTCEADYYAEAGSCKKKVLR